MTNPKTDNKTETVSSAFTQLDGITSYRPTDNTDVGEASLFADIFKETVRYSTETGFLIFDGRRWRADALEAHKLVQEFTEKQLEDAQKQLTLAKKNATKAGITVMLDAAVAKTAERCMNDEQRQLCNNICDAQKFLNFVSRCRSSKGIRAILTEAPPRLRLDCDKLDQDPFLLCTPTATYDLSKGLNGQQPHSPKDYITKITNCSPGDKGADLWKKSLNQFFCEDQKLIDYVQQICGLAAVGRIFSEALVIAYGSGRNGKSSFWNVISKVLGDYSGSVSADILTFQHAGNYKNELAEIRGKRFLIAAEMSAGARLNDSLLKQLCSTDKIAACKKYKDPFAFLPSHTIVLCTNHLPEVAARDDGTWRRMIVIPFHATFDGDSTIKDYADYLFQNAGESILSWIIEGAKKIIDAEYKLVTPECVQKEINDYRLENNWFAQFLEDCCEVGSDYRAPSGALYNTYRSYCQYTYKNACSTTVFYHELKTAGFHKVKVNSSNYICGLRIK